MSKQQVRLLLCTVVAIALLVPALFMDWFVFDRSEVGVRLSLSMTSSTACGNGECKSISLYMLGGMFSRMSRAAFGGGIILILLVLFQSGTKLFTDHAHPKLSRIGYVGGAFVLANTIIFTYFIGPDFGGARRAFALSFEHTLAPPMFLGGLVAALAALYYAAHDGYDDMGGEYKPVVVPKRDVPVTPLSVNRVPHPGSGAIAKPVEPGVKIGSGPIVKPIAVERVITPPARERLPDSIPLEGDIHARTSDSGPIPKQSAQSGSGPTRTSDSGPIPKQVAQPGSGPNVARTRAPSQPGSGTSVGMARSKPGSNPPAVARTTSPDRTKAPSQPPAVARTTSPDRASSPQLETEAPSAPRTRSPSSDVSLDLGRARTSSSGPIDLAARLSGAPLEVAIKPPKPAPVPVPPDQIPVAPESGLVIRKRTPSAAPLRSPMAGVEPQPQSASAMPGISIADMDLASDLQLDTGPAAPPERPKSTTERPKSTIAGASTVSGIATITGIAGDAREPALDIRAPSRPEPRSTNSGISAEARRPAPISNSPANEPKSTTSGVASETRPPAFAAPKPADMGDLALAIGAGPSALRGKIRYAVSNATLSSTGIAAQREDGAKKLVPWDSIVGLIARRLPNEAPYEGSSFVDVVSTAGATLRFLPWSKIDGAPIRGEGEERVRAFLQLLAARCLDAKLDSWTKVFADGAGRAAQLQSTKVLTHYDERLA